MKKGIFLLALTAGLAASMRVNAQAAGWIEAEGGWKYMTGDDGVSCYNDGWHWLDGNQDGVAECYYFGSDGYLLVNTTTPDQYSVSGDGAWIRDGIVQRRYAHPKGPGEIAFVEGQTSPEGGTGAGASASGQGTDPAGPAGPGAGLPGTAQGPGGTDGSQAAGPGAAQGPGAEESAAAEVPEGMFLSAGRLIDTARPMVALTFDDGPQTAVGNQIMNCLAAYGGKATFFVVGERCASRAAELQRMVAEGHEIGNHTYSHALLNKKSADVIRSQVDQGVAAITAASGVPPALMRLPGGNQNSTVLANVNYPMIQWSIDTRDWESRNTQSVVNIVLSQVRDGDIVLMHELYATTGAAVEQIVPELVNRGYQLVTVSEMARARGVLLVPGQLYYSMRP